jgi:hypothetical protein
MNFLHVKLVQRVEDVYSSLFIVTCTVMHQATHRTDNVRSPHRLSKQKQGTAVIGNAELFASASANISRFDLLAINRALQQVNNHQHPM